jgi:ATP-dependent helicase/nuclease subunit A
MANKWTTSQKHAIFDNGGTLLVSAAAGSGKTSVLVERVIQKLISEENPVDADRLLSVTFSNAAAQEMKERIYKKLSELAQDKRYYHALSKQMFLLESANICTIHSFCIKLLRQYFEQLDLSPTFRIADEGEVTVLKSAAITKVLEKYYKQNDRDFLDLLELLGSFRDDSDLVKRLLVCTSRLRRIRFLKTGFLQG